MKYWLKTLALRPEDSDYAGCHSGLDPESSGVFDFRWGLPLLSIPPRPERLHLTY